MYLEPDQGVPASFPGVLLSQGHPGSWGPWGALIPTTSKTLEVLGLFMVLQELHRNEILQPRP